MLSEKKINYIIMSRKRKPNSKWTETIYSLISSWYAAKGKVNSLAAKYPDQEFRVDVTIRYTITPNNSRF